MELPFVVVILMASVVCTDAQRYFPSSPEGPGYGGYNDPGYNIPQPYPPPPPPPGYPAPP
ncbi:hypothetical protein JD844_005696, partial [Phrynosoma platyrhinos]